MPRIGALIRLARPTHWVKNLIVLLPVVFALRVGDPVAWLRAGIATVAFCLISSTVYVMNDLRDAPQDRLHPVKSRRPIASGEVSPAAAMAWMLLLGSAAFAVAIFDGLLTVGFVAGYFLLQVFYTLLLKHRPIVDVMVIATGFVLRAVAGAVAIRAEVSPWLVVCAFTICLFMGFCKRRNEAATLTDERRGAKHRSTLAAYTPELLTHLITLSAGLAIVSYLLYTVSPRTVSHFGTTYLMYTVPPVIYGIARFAMLSMTARYAGPVELAMRDRPIQVAVALWAISAGLLAYFGPGIQDWIGQNY